MSWKKITENSGISSVPLIIALVLMITVGGFFISLMLGKHIGAPWLAQSTKALFISDAGIEYTHEYLKSYVDWTTVPDIASTSFGDGTFAVAFTNKALNSVTATSTGTIGNAVRVITIDFERTSVMASNPVTGVCEEEEEEEEDCVEVEDNAIILCQGGAPCDPLEPLDNPPYTCLCTYQLTGPLQPPNPPSLPNAAWSCPPTPERSYTGTVNISVNCTFPPGTYYFEGLEIRNGAVVTVEGPVAIWILDEFGIRDNSQFNWGGIAANLLLLAADYETEFALRDSARFKGAIYAPNGEVELHDSAQVVGAIVGSEVELRDNTTVTHDPDAGRNAPGYEQTRVVVKASDWGEI